MGKQQTQQALSERKCSACKGDLKPLSKEEIQDYLKELKGWEFAGGVIRKSFKFSNYYETVSFVNAIAWVAHREDHHPDIAFGYKECVVSLKTHAIKGISENDFIVAAKTDALMEPSDS